MFSCLYIPRFCLEAALKAHPATAPDSAVAVMDDAAAHEKKARIIAVSGRAEAQLVECGMTATQGLARCAGLTLFHRDRNAENCLQATLLEAAEKWTPHFENTAPGTCTLDLIGLPEARAHPERLCARLVAGLRAAGLADARAGIAGTPDLAFIAARLGRLGEPACVLPADPAALRQRLAHIPLRALLPSSASLLEVLDLWGVRHLGELAPLDRTSIGERLGQEALHLHDLCFGKGTRLLRLATPPRDYSARLEVDHDIQELEPLLFILRRLLESVCARLAATYHVAGAIDLSLLYRNGATAMHTRHFRVPEPTVNPGALFEILHAWLDTFTSEAALCGAEITAHPTRAHGQQRRLFEASIRNPARFEQTLARLEALFGTPNVGTPRPLASRRPDAFEIFPYHYHNPELEAPPGGRMREEAGQRQRAGGRKPAPPPVERARAQTGDTPLGLPMRRLRPPERIEVVTEPAADPHAQRPTAILTGPARGALTPCHGPWATSGDWWDASCWTRLEWDVRHEASGTLYRVYRDRNGWFLEGVYG